MNNENNNLNSQIYSRKIIGYNPQTGEPIYENIDVNQVLTQPPLNQNNNSYHINKKNNNKIVIIILVLIIIGLLGIIGFMFTKIDKNSSIENNNQQNNSNLGNENNNQVDNINSTNIDKDEYVGIAFSRYATVAWPENRIEKYNGDPDYLVRRIDIPKLLFDTDNAKKLNEKIYNSYKNDINNLNVDTEKPYYFNIDYDYSVKENIVFLSITRLVGSSRGSGFSQTNIYYYDIKNDKELTLDEVCNLFNITLEKVKTKDKSAESMYAVMADNFSSLRSYIVYYKQDSTCPSFGCLGEAYID